MNFYIFLGTTNHHCEHRTNGYKKDSDELIANEQRKVRCQLFNRDLYEHKIGLVQ